MKLKFNKYILLIVVACMIAGMIIGCKDNNDIEEDVMVTEEKVVEETKAVNITETTKTTEETEAAEDEIEEETEDKDNYSENTSNSNPPVVTKPTETTKPIETTASTETTVPTEIVEPTEKIEEETEEEIEEETEDKVESSLTSLGNFKLTAYCACPRCCGKSDGITATGTVATQGRTIAVDPSVIPYGTSVVINGNTYIAEDCGGAIGGNRIDVFFNNHQDALNFGVQYAEVFVIS